jgi:geranylgeranyl diphosphate synthase, type II
MISDEVLLGELQKIQDEAIRNFPEDLAGLYDPLKHMLGQKGKQVRPLLCLRACLSQGGSYENAIMPALALEWFHNFTLIHDDVMDNADTRRGLPTVAKKWGANAALLSGDVLLMKSMQLLHSYSGPNKDRITELFIQMATGICEGQQMDMDFEKKENAGLEGYIEMVSLKTAILFGSSLKIGALAGNGGEQEANHLFECGLKIGIAFQILDDLMDVFPRSEQFGKKVGGDIIQGKKTWLRIKAENLADQNPLQKKELVMAFNEPDLEKRVEWVKQHFRNMNIEALALQEAGNFSEAGFDHLRKTKPSVYRDQLENLLKNLLNRLS